MIIDILDSFILQGRYQTFLNACPYFHIRHAKRDNLVKLRGALVRHW